MTNVFRAAVASIVRTVEVKYSRKSGEDFICKYFKCLGVPTKEILLICLVDRISTWNYWYS
jgi:hypothetical protein